LQHVIGYVRAFLRFEHETGTLAKPLHTMIDTPRIYRLERLPCHLPWETVRQLLRSIDRSDFSGLRDHAMLYLMAGYGLRSCEVVSLTLDDIDWRKCTLRIAQRKTRSQLTLPLTDAAGEMLIGYLKKRKPDIPYRELFFRVRAPSGTLKPTGIVEAFQRRVRRSGLTIAYQGPHCLRHSYAVHLLRQGASVKTIGDLLGHRDAESTCVYLRLATEDLRLVALPVPQGAKDGPRIEIGPVGPFSKQGPRRKKPRQATSFLAPEIEDYLALKRALGRQYCQEASILYDFDAFVATRQEMCGEIFCQWAATLELLSATVRRNWMRIVRNFCLYRLRSDPGSFVPDLLSFPIPHQSLTPWLLNESDIARLLSATQHLRPTTRSPLRPEALRVGILLLYSAGLRRGELLRLTLGDYNPAEGTLLIRATKFHKTRLIPLSPGVCSELGAFLALRSKKRLPMEAGSALIWNGHGGDGGYTGTGFAHNWSALCKALQIFTDKGKPPRIHDLRHSFAFQVLRRDYLAGGDVQAKLPLLSIYMGHVSIASTHYYLPFVEEIRAEAGDRFHRSFGVQLLEWGGEK
jgi:site-specific recombinase XerD